MRLKKQGKPHKVVIGAISRKLVTIANAILKSTKPWRSNPSTQTQLLVWINVDSGDSFNKRFIHLYFMAVIKVQNLQWVVMSARKSTIKALQSQCSPPSLCHGSTCGLFLNFCSYFFTRSIFKTAMCILFGSLVLTGCGPSSTQSGFFRNGIGAKLPAADVAKAGSLQRKYFNYLCQQAGLMKASYGDPARDCILEPYDADIWTLIVYQGFNDIDRRCDAYLEWLDNKKRSKQPLLSQVSSVGAATAGIMGITGTSTKALTIAALAFDLVKQSIENYHSRLLLEVEQSTINSIVFRARHNFRTEFVGRQVSNKPEAEYVLRSYLRICLPFAIESTINDNSTLVSLGVNPLDADKGSIHQTPVVDEAIAQKSRTAFTNKPENPTVIIKRESVSQAKLDEIRKGLRKEIENALYIGGAKNGIESKIQKGEGKLIQSALCLEGADINANFGDFGSPTRKAIEVFKRGTQKSGEGGQLFAREVLQTIRNDSEKREIQEIPCKGSLQWTTATEKYFYSSGAKIERLQKIIQSVFEKDVDIKGKNRALDKMVANNTFVTKKFDILTREAITHIKILKKSGKDGKLNYAFHRELQELATLLPPP